MTLFRGTGENLPLDRWLHEVLWPREARLTPEDVYWGMTLGASELLRFGVTTTSEMYFFEDALADAVVAAGSRAVICPGVLQLPGLEGQSWSKRLSEIVDFHRRRHGASGRVEVGFGPHAPYTVPLDVLAETAELARELDALFHIHVAETRGEVDRFAAEHGCTVPAALARAGVLDARVLAAHSIWLSDADLDLYAAHDVAVAHCPQSNAKLASGVARLEDMLNRGIRVGLATDGPASNNDLDLWEDMRLAVLLARIRSGDATSLPAARLLDLVTRNGAAALGRDDLGSLHAGAKADMILMNLDDPAFVPLLDEQQLIEHLVWSTQSRLVTDVWVGGRQVVAAGECLTVDGSEARRQVQQRARRLAGV
jgi:5-methylthioadenosine/S-adenosylhomocysteine deaminase